MAVKREKVTPAKRRHRNQGQKVRVDISHFSSGKTYGGAAGSFARAALGLASPQEAEMSIALYQDAIAAMASAAAERIRKALRNPHKKRLKKSTRERRERLGIRHDTPWVRTGALRDSIVVQRVGDFEDVITNAHRLQRHQRNGILREAGLMGQEKQATYAAIEREVMDLLIADSEHDAQTKDRKIQQLIRRNKKGRI